MSRLTSLASSYRARVVRNSLSAAALAASSTGSTRASGRAPSDLTRHAAPRTVTLVASVAWAKPSNSTPRAVQTIVIKYQNALDQMHGVNSLVSNLKVSYLCFYQEMDTVFTLDMVVSYYRIGLKLTFKLYSMSIY